jgi:short-subunit dehydrogenase
MRVLVTGAASGIGKATVEKLLEQDHEIIAFDIDEDNLNSLPEIVEKYHGDVYDEDRVKEVVEREEFDVLVNCAGYYELGAIEDMDPETVEAHFKTNVFGTLNMIRNSSPQLREKKGRIVNVSSIAGKISLPFYGTYSATKYSIEAISDALRYEMQPFDVDVVIVEPGPIDTGFNERARQKLKQYLPDSVYSERYQKVLENGGRAEVGAKKAAEMVVQAVESHNPKNRYIVTSEAWLMPKLKRFLPSRVWEYIIRKGMDY